MERKRIYLSSPTMHGEEQAFVQSAFDTNWVAPLGPNVDAFEKEMADYICGSSVCRNRSDPSGSDPGGRKRRGCCVCTVPDVCCKRKSCLL